MADSTILSNGTPAGNTILRTERHDYQRGCLSVFAQAGPYDSHGPCFEFQLPDAWKMGDVDALIASRLAADVESAKIAAVDAALQAEFEKRKASVDYAKSGADAVTTVFGAPK